MQTTSAGQLSIGAYTQKRHSRFTNSWQPGIVSPFSPEGIFRDMRIAVPKERRPQERRVAVSPDTAKRLVGMGHEVVVEAGAGVGAAFPDTAYSAVGATIAGSQAEALGTADVILKVQRPEPQEVSAMKRGVNGNNNVVDVAISNIFGH